MLQILREKKSGLFVKIVLGIVVIGFSFFGIESYFISQTSTDVAVVGKTSITQDQFRERFGEYRQQMTRMMGDRVDGEFFQRIEVKRQVLDQLINEQVLLNANEELGVVVPADAVRKQIASFDAFLEDGKFDPSRYRTILAGQGMTPLGFEQRVRQDIAVRTLPNEVTASALVTEADVDAYLRLRNQTRDFRFIRLDKPEPPSEEVGADEIETWYADHQDDFMTPEQVSLQYLELDASALDVAVTPDESTLRDRYEKEKARFVTEEQRLASHILVKVPGNGSPDDQKAALAEARALRQQIEDGADFATVAKAESDDLGSKNQGGDLGWLEKGMTDPAFDDALFAMDKGTLSEPILSSEGYHIIELRDVRPGSTRSFEEVRPDLVREYTETEHDRVFNEKAGRLTDLTYQDPSSLAPAAEDLGLEIKTTGMFQRTGGDGIAANPDVVKAAFSDNVLVQGNNSDPVALGPDKVVVVRVAEHQPSKAKPLDEVRDTIRDRIIAERVASAAKKHADALFATLEKDHDLAALATANDLEVTEQVGIGRNAMNVDRTVVGAVFAMPRPTTDKPSYRLVALADDAYALVELLKATDGDPSKLDEKTREAARNTIVQARGSLFAREFVEALRNRSEIKVSEDRLP